VVETTTDPERVRASEQVAVTARVADLEGAERLQLAAGAVGRGEYDDAQRLIREEVSAVRQQAAEMPSAGQLDAEVGRPPAGEYHRRPEHGDDSIMDALGNGSRAGPGLW